jgi:hypothetical protein
MLSSITPLGERSRNRRWGTTVAAYVVGSTVGGMTTGVLMGGIGALVATVAGPPTRFAAWLLVAVVALAACHEAGWLRFRLPTVQRQVNEDWLDEYRGWVTGAGFGLQLGAGLTTIVTSSVGYVVWIAALLTFSPRSGLLIGAVYGLTRALPLLATRAVHTPIDLRSWHTSMHRRGVWVQTSVAATTGAVALAGAILIVSGRSV